MSNDRTLVPFLKRPSPAEEFAATARRLKHEREMASQLVEPLLRRTSSTEWPSLAENTDLRTAGALERLSDIFSNTLTKEPLRAKVLAELAVSLAEAIDPTAYPPIILAQLQASAWKDHGKVLRFIGKNPEAIKSFRLAEHKLDAFSVLAHDRAAVRFNLAMSLQEMEQFKESQALLSESREVFRDHGDARNAILCGLAEGVLLQRMGRFRDARETYLLLLASTRDIDTESLAAIHHAIGFCSIELEAYADADSNLRHAIALYRQVGQPMVILKVELGRGRLFIRRGEPAHSIAHLRPVRRDFLRNGMHEEAGICGLEIVEAFLLLGRASEAETLARKIVREFTLAELNKRAIIALSYLTETIITRQAQPSLVSQVREYILSLRVKPEREFQLT
jgi:tetratricopeptide (TPR) repeat protein